MKQFYTCKDVMDVMGVGESKVYKIIKLPQVYVKTVGDQGLKEGRSKMNEYPAEKFVAIYRKCFGTTELFYLYAIASRRI